ncbi:OLC1v1011514C1 [Oldenlandia corymbosa var. corymbosa]|uniref:OLC1v1011514C1 n=1 Tax=Oldenlandia corymbosa var. corymbosa TaxID=529605 RepID=A0AAV1DW42_OLDCO|nr:OLC1v1011514C1 [Oldenlandia corymbosa var. corymbosa]
MDRHFVEECISNSKMRAIADSDDEKWLLSEDPNNNDLVEEEEEDDDDEEALSLCDLPINEENRQSRKETVPPPKPIADPSEDFNFCSWVDPISKEPEMCAADEVFFQGQILPMRHSISFDNGRNTTIRCLSRSESMGHSSSYSVGFTSASSRSSSINSHHSSISTGSTNSCSSSIKFPKNKTRCPKTPIQFQFSHPSPKPQIRHSKSKNRGNTSIHSNQNSTFWSFLRVGLVTTPEIAMQDLKFRSKSNNSSKNFGSRNSTSNLNSTTVKETGEKKQGRHQRKFFDKNSVFFSGCKCSSNSVVGPVPSRVPINSVTRSASAKGMASHADQEEDDIRTTKHRETGRKQSLSRHRTFEWLRQLSLEAAAAASPVVIDEAEKNQQH